MIDIGSKEEPSAETLLPSLSQNVQKLFKNTYKTPLGRWLVIEVSDKNILCDVKKLVDVRIITSDNSESVSDPSVSERRQSEK